MDNNRILCVDDDIGMLNTIEDILISAGYSVSLAKSGRQALELLKKGISYQLVLLDVDMPEMDGYETFKAIRELDPGKEIPIIFLTGKSDRESVMKVMQLKPQGYLLKNMNKTEILKAVGDFFEAEKLKKHKV